MKLKVKDFLIKTITTYAIWFKNEQVRKLRLVRDILNWMSHIKDFYFDKSHSEKLYVQYCHLISAGPGRSLRWN